jgi:hypothetical protein
MFQPQRSIERRALLRHGDRLLDAVEELTACKFQSVPASLRQLIGAFVEAVTGQAPVKVPARPGLAHSLLLEVEGALLDRSARVHRIHRIVAGRGSTDWLVVELPRLGVDGITPEWIEIAEAAVERTFHRWAWSQYHTRAAAEHGSGLITAWRRQELAWSNYWRLHEELSTLVGGP